MSKIKKAKILWCFAFSISLLWLILLSSWKNNWKDSIDNLTDGVLQSRISLSGCLLILSITSILYLLICASCFTHKQTYRIRKSHKILVILNIILPLSLISAEVAVGTGNFYTTERMLECAFPIIQLTLIFYSPLVTSFILHQNMNKFIYLGVASIYLQLLVAPVFFKSSHIVSSNELPPKPLLIAHRGMRSLAPENTLSAFMLAEEHGLFGIEGDIQISLDGIPFMMHDSSLLRTTNVKSVYPKRIFDKASNFTWKELQKLDAGSWFSREYTGEKIPSLYSILKFLKSSNLIFIFDLKMPHSEHPYYSKFRDTVVRAINISEASQQIFWLFNLDTFYNDSLREEETNIIKSKLPGAQMVAPATYKSSQRPSTNLIEQEKMLVNTFHGIGNKDLENYITKTKVNTWTVNEDWLFGQMWLKGVYSVTTNNPIRFQTMKSPPIWHITKKQYFILWVTFDCVSVLFIVMQLIWYFKQKYTSIQYTALELQVH